jgi:hypothetical protein
MQPSTEQELAAVRDRHRTWLRQQPGFTGSFISRDKQGQPVLVLQFNPVTPEVHQKVAQRFEGVPVEIHEVPIARAY